MQFQGTSVPDQPLPAQVVGPVISGPTWFDPAPFVVRLEHPLTFDEMVAALYSTPYLTVVDIESAEDIWGYVASTVTERGMVALGGIAASIEAGWVSEPGWLTACRQAVSALCAQTGAAVAA